MSYEKVIVDVVIPWKLSAIGPVVLTVLCRSEQIVEYTMFPQCVRFSSDPMYMFERVLKPFHSRFAFFGGSREEWACPMLQEKFVEYNAWQYPTKTSVYSFHLLNFQGLMIQLRTETQRETGHRFFEAPDWLRVKDLLRKSRGVDEYRLRHEHFLGLRHLHHRLCESVQNSPKVAAI